jgi:hypothetical protein
MKSHSMNHLNFHFYSPCCIILYTQMFLSTSFLLYLILCLLYKQDQTPSYKSLYINLSMKSHSMYHLNFYFYSPCCTMITINCSNPFPPYTEKQMLPRHCKQCTFVGWNLLTACWLWSLIIFLIQRSLLSAVFIPHEVFTPQKYVHSSTRGSAEGGYPLCRVRGGYPPRGGLGASGPPAGVRGQSPRRKNCLVNVYCNFIVNLDRSL